MADLRSRIGIKIVDPTTDANEVGVDASGNLQAILASNTGVDIGDVDVLTLPTSPDTIADDAAFTAASKVFPFGAVMDETAPDPVDEGDIGYLRMSAVRSLHVEIRDGANGERSANVDASNNLSVILAANTGVDIGDVDVLTMPATAAEAAALPAVFTVVAGDDGVDTHPLQLDASGFLKAILQANTGVDIGDVDILSGPTGASALEMQGTAADGTAPAGDPVLIAGWDSTNLQILATDTSGNLQVDVLTGGGESVPVGEALAVATSAALAAGSSADLDSAEFGGSTKKLRGVDVSASVPVKVEIQEVNDGTGTNKVVIFGRASEPIQWRAAHRDYLEKAFTANAGFDGFRAKITNLDNSQAADVYATLYTED